VHPVGFIEFRAEEGRSNREVATIMDEEESSLSFSDDDSFVLVEEDVPSARSGAGWMETESLRIFFIFCDVLS